MYARLRRLFGFAAVIAVLATAARESGIVELDAYHADVSGSREAELKYIHDKRGAHSYVLTIRRDGDILHSQTHSGLEPAYEVSGELESLAYSGLVRAWLPLVKIFELDYRCRFQSPQSALSGEISGTASIRVFGPCSIRTARALARKEALDQIVEEVREKLGA